VPPLVHGLLISHLSFGSIFKLTNYEYRDGVISREYGANLITDRFYLFSVKSSPLSTFYCAASFLYLSSRVHVHRVTSVMSPIPERNIEPLRNCGYIYARDIISSAEATQIRSVVERFSCGYFHLVTLLFSQARVRRLSLLFPPIR
jgi:hypothetical protein